MKNWRIFAAIAVLVCGFGLAVSLYSKPAEGAFIFKDIQGPRDTSVIPAEKDSQWTQYRGGGDSRLALLLTDTQSNWLGLAHGFKSLGISFSITTDTREAVRHKVVMVYPIVAGSVVSAESSKALENFVREGGTLIGSEVLGAGLESVFGFAKAVTFEARYELKFLNAAPDADPLEKKIPIDNQTSSPMGAFGYTRPVEPPLAVYEDGSAAIIHHHFGNGSAVAFGFDLGALLLKGYNNRQENMARSYDNGYEPTLDVLLRLIGDIYRKGEDRAVMLQPVPEGKKLAVLLTHDIDYTRSLGNAVDYATFEHEAGIPATYFMQTKYIRDYNDDVILGADSPKYLEQLRDFGMELASHTVSHSHSFVHFPLGKGNESYPAYHPFVADRENTTGGTILGELRVSRFLIEQLVPGAHIDSFRPGYLSDPYALPQALVATGYHYSSSVTANDSLTHLPFQLDYGRETKSEVPVFEFPITIADGPPLLTDRLPQGVDLAKKIARKGGLCVVLIHPDVVEPKLGFEKKFVAGIRDFSWFGTMSDYGRWWEARNEVQIDSHWQDGKLIAHIDAPAPIEGLTLTPPAGMVPAAGQPLVKISGEHAVVLGELSGRVDVVFVRK